ncbi:MAG: VWA domain-containing protein [Terriglobia bacterium]
MAIAVGESRRVGLSVLRSLVILLLLTFAPCGLRAQAVPAPAATASQASGPTFKLQVQKNEVVVRVVVRDSHGRAQAGLRQEDFKITDNGKPQTISSFSVQARPVAISSPGLPATAPPAKAAEGQKEEAPPLAPPAYLGLYFDDLNSAFDSLVRVRDAAEKFIAGVPPSERIAIFTSSGNQSLDFTSDRQKLHEALFKLHANLRLDPRMSCPEITDFLADQIVNHEDPDAFRIVRDEAINECQMDARSVQDQWIRMLAQGAYEAFLMQARADIASLDNAVQRVAEMPGERQLMLVSDGFMTLEMHDRLERVIDKALHLRVIISALDGKGLAVQLREADASRQYAPAGNLAGLYHMYDTSREAAATGTLAEIADATGGQFVHNSNDLLGGLRKALLAPEAAYVLTFSPENLKENGAFHTLKVRLLNGHGLTVQARKGYFAPSKQTTPEERAKDEIREAVLSPDRIQDLPLEVQAQGRKIGPQKAEITVQARLDVRALSFRREGDRNINKIIFTVALFDTDGKFVSGKQEEHGLALRDTTLANLQKSGLDFQAQLLVTPGTYTVRVVARDSEKGAMAALSRAVEIPQ